MPFLDTLTKAIEACSATNARSFITHNMFSPLLFGRWGRFCYLDEQAAREARWLGEADAGNENNESNESKESKESKEGKSSDNASALSVLTEARNSLRASSELRASCNVLLEARAGTDSPIDRMFSPDLVQPSRENMPIRHRPSDDTRDPTNCNLKASSGNTGAATASTDATELQGSTSQ